MTEPTLPPPAVAAPLLETAPARQEWIRARVAELGDWFHNLNLEGVETAPGHFLGDYPALKWRQIEPALPARLDGLTVLDIGCNAGFYALECKRRGAARVVGIDADARYLAQARLASDITGLELELHQLSVYALAEWRERFDLVLFMGLFYHLRYPLYALDLIVKLMRGTLVFQTMLRGEEASERPQKDYPFRDETPFRQPGFPAMYFIEHAYAGDPTNWWIPNRAGMEAMLRSAGLRLVAHPERESWICRTEPWLRETAPVWDRELAGRL